MIGILAGALIGVSISAGAWWIQYRMLTPDVVFADGISRLSDDIGPVYRLKIANQSRRRGVIDLTFDAVVALGKGVVTYREAALTNTQQSLKIQVRGDRVTRLQPRGNRIRRLDLRGTSWDGVNPRLLAAVGIDPISEQEVPLEQLLAATESAYLQIRVLAYDEVSGSRKYFASPRYRLADIQKGGFVGMKVRRQSHHLPVKRSGPRPIAAGGDAVAGDRAARAEQGER
ncbi:MAG TPA: hypothetical protein VHU13_05885 [Solirubrobacteraceae bacterium]|jgi:hypothetical protein|nr:hypothetical protein [Solirubrobacteraceae bacterium]